MKALLFGTALSAVVACGTTVPLNASDAGSGASDAGDPVATITSFACPGAKAGTSLLATTPNDIDAMVSDGTTLYWLDGSSGILRAVPVAGGETTVVGTASPLWNGPCGPAPANDDCGFWSLAVDDTSVYVAGPLGIYSFAKGGTGGAAHTLAKYDGTSAYAMGPLVLGGGALFWVELDFVTEDDQPTLTARVMKLGLTSDAAPVQFPDDSRFAETAAILTGDSDQLYWLGLNSIGGGEGILATPFAGGTTSTVVAPTDTLAVVENMTVAGGRVAWDNAMLGGGCVCPGPPQSPSEPVRVEDAPIAGGAIASLLSYPGDEDPTVFVLSDSAFVYAVNLSKPGAIAALPSSGGAAMTLLEGPELDLAVGDACNIYFASAGDIQKVAKPAAP